MTNMTSLKELCDRYEQTGRIARIRRTRDKKIFVSLNGREMSAKEAIKQMKEFFANNA